MADDDALDSIRRGWGKRLLSTGRIAASAARLAARRAVGAEGRTDEALGRSLARELDQMKGMAMKVGQVLSYFDGILPPSAQLALRPLLQGAKPLAWERIAAQIEQAFARPVDELFDAIEPEPVAAASIGQVHRALFEGRPVAVKVQYPGIRQTIEGDFSRLRGLSRIASLATAVDGPAIVEDMRSSFAEECDYELEAANQNAFAAAFADDPEIAIPAAIAERTRTVVLTTEWAEGLSFHDFAAQADPDRRNAVGLVLARFAFRSLFGLGTLNADPHPGNYVLGLHGPVTFLDFGCVRRFDAAFVEAERALARVVLDDRRAEFRDAVVATGTVPRPDRFDFDTHWDMLAAQYAPYLEPGYRFDGTLMQQMSRYSGPRNPNLRRLAIPPAWVWMQRLVWSLHAVLTQLRAEGDFRSVLRAALDTPLAPLPPARM